ncbi:MAG: redoxin domain-containing protein [Chloroflexi bacterium]|nr:redoxin domain-containing protein [Chloroflexota bacterium]
MEQIDARVADFEAEAYQNDEIKKVKLSDYKGKWVVLIFYPGDFTFICPTELEEAATYYDQFKGCGAEVFGVSTDSVWVHKAWHDESAAISTVQYPLIADPTGKLSRQFGVYIEAEGVARRGSFIIDPDGVLRVAEIHNNSIGRNTKELLRKLQAAMFVRENDGEVCPASWEPGKTTLQPGLALVGKI